MTSLGLIATLLTLAAVFGVINSRTMRLPNSIGVLVIALLATLLMLAVDPLIPRYDLREIARGFLGTIDLPKSLLNFALSFLLFAGALQVDLRELWSRRFRVLALAVLGTLLAVSLFGGAMYLAFPLVGPPVPLVWCMVLGAILAPTDPVSVVGMLRRIGLPAPLQAVFAGESLFNDGVGVVVFGVALGIATGTGEIADLAQVVSRFAAEPIGGGLLGLGAGWVALRLMHLTEDAHLELIISLALATGAFSLANALHLSGPIAVVVAGLALGSRGNRHAISDKGYHELTTFWSLIDEVLNSLLFLLIGFEIVTVAFRLDHLAAILIAIPLSIAVRGLSVLLVLLPLHMVRKGQGRAMVVLTWGGLRGGISVALALGLPDAVERPSLLAVCYGVVVFTIVVQGLTIERVARRFYRLPEET